MGDFSETIPSFAAGERVRASKLQTLANFASASSGAMTTYTPTHANLTSTSPTVVARYRRIGKKLSVFWSYTIGSAPTVGTLPSFTLPLGYTPNASRLTAMVIGRGQAFDTGTNNYDILGRWTGSAVELIVPGTNNIHQSLTGAVPFTFVAGDRLMCELVDVELV